MALDPRARLIYARGSLRNAIRDDGLLRPRFQPILDRLNEAIAEHDEEVQVARREYAQRMQSRDPHRPQDPLPSSNGREIHISGDVRFG